MKKLLIFGASSDIGLELIELCKTDWEIIAQGNNNFANISPLINRFKYAFTPENVSECIELKSLLAIDAVVILIGKTDFTFGSNLNIYKWNEMLFANLILPSLILKELYPKLNNNATVVFCSSYLADHGEIGMSHYSAAKAGLKAFMLSLVKEWEHKKIRLNCVQPHLIDTANTKKMPIRIKETYIKRNPLNRIGKPRDVSEMITFLISEKATYINGQSIIINGGEGAI